MLSLSGARAGQYIGVVHSPCPSDTGRPQHARRWLAGLLLAGVLSAGGAAAAPPAATMARGDSLYALERYIEARSVYQAVAEAEPQNGRAWYRTGLCSMGLKEYDRALPALTRAEAIGHNPTVMYNLACAHARLGQSDAAFDWLDTAITAGLPNPEQFLTDDDLAALRSLPRYAALVTTAHRAQSPCTYRPEARQFDFWLGAWEVRNTAGQVAGHNVVQVLLNDCVLQENWTGSLGGSGKSVNFFNAATGHWEQIWMDDKGATTHFVGDLVENVMRFQSEAPGPGGQPTRNHLSFFPLAPDHVRQLAESSTDGGRTWTVVYDLHYFRQNLETPSPGAR